MIGITYFLWSNMPIYPVQHIRQRHSRLKRFYRTKCFKATRRTWWIVLTRKFPREMKQVLLLSESSFVCISLLWDIWGIQIEVLSPYLHLSSFCSLHSFCSLFHYFFSWTPLWVNPSTSYHHNLMSSRALPTLNTCARARTRSHARIKQPSLTLSGC